MSKFSEKPYPLSRVLWVLGLMFLLMGCIEEKVPSNNTASNQVSGSVLHGQFLDAATEGISYRSDSYDGLETDSEGRFIYEEGDTISFSVGGVFLGTSKAKPIITPVDLVENGSLGDERVKNITRFLQTLDQDGNPDNGIVIPEEVRQAAESVPHNLLQPGVLTDQNGKESAMLTEFLGIAGISGGLIPESFAMTHLRSNVRKNPEEWSIDLKSVFGNVGTTLPDATGLLKFYYQGEELLVDGSLSFPSFPVEVTPSVGVSSDGVAATTSVNSPLNGALSVAFTGAKAVLRKKDSGSGFLSITLFNDVLDTTAQSSTNVASFSFLEEGVDAALLSSAINSVVINAEVDLGYEIEETMIRSANLSIRFAETLWDQKMGLGSVNGSWSMNKSQGGALIREVVRSVHRPDTKPSWELFGIKKTSQEWSAELTGSVYKHPSLNRRNLQLITSENNPNIGTTGSSPIYLNTTTNEFKISLKSLGDSFVGFVLYLHDSNVHVNTLTFNGKNITSTEDSYQIKPNVIPNISLSNLSGVSNDLGKDLSLVDGRGKTWHISDETQGDGVLSVVFTDKTLSCAECYGYQFLDLSREDNILVLHIVEIEQQPSTE